jgi:hypothetical protein
MSDTSGTDMSKTLEGWRKLAFQMEPSDGPYSGYFTPGATATNDAQWLRQVSLIVYGSGTGADVNGSTGGTAAGTNAKQGLELAELRVEFTVNRTTNSSPNLLRARVYNMAPQTMKKVYEFTRVQLSAGYKYANYGVIFDGTVVQYRRGKENPTDTYLEIHAGDGDTIMNTATSYMKFQKGVQDKAVINALVNNLVSVGGATLGFIDPSIGQGILQRGKTLAGATRDHLRDYMNKEGANMYVDLGVIYVVRKDKYLPGQEVVLNPKTGLVSIPEVTPQGIQARCLLNPKIRLGGVIRIDKELLSGVAFVPGSGAEWAQGMPTKSIATGDENFEVAPTSPTGRYKVIMMTYTGDTRGQPWYCDMTCVALDADGNVMIENPSTVFKRRSGAPDQ